MSPILRADHMQWNLALRPLSVLQYQIQSQMMKGIQLFKINSELIPLLAVPWLVLIVRFYCTKHSQVRYRDTTGNLYQLIKLLGRI